MPVVDTNVFIRGRRTPFDSALTIPEVTEELESDAARRKFDLADVDIMEPAEDSIETVSDKAEELRSPTSEVDEKLLALALETGQKVITDDKALQNLALHLEIDFESYMADEINERKHWEERCPNCGDRVDGECPSCGEESIRRLV